MEKTDSTLTDQITLDTQAEKICFELTSFGEPDRQKLVNNMFDIYELCVRDNLPSLTETEKLTIFAAYNGKISVDIIYEIQKLHIDVHDAYIYDTLIRKAIDNSDTEIEEFIERIESWSFTQKMAVYHAAKAFWRKGQEWKEIYNGKKYL